MRNNQGFTLIELLVVVAVVGILAAAVVSGINPTARFADARDAQRKQIAQSIAQAIEACYTKNQGSYTNCTSLTTLNTNNYLRFDYGSTYDVDSDTSTPTLATSETVFSIGTTVNAAGAITAVCSSAKLENSLTEGSGTAICAAGCSYWKYISTRARSGFSATSASATNGCVEANILFK